MCIHILIKYLMEICLYYNWIIIYKFHFSKQRRWSIDFITSYSIRIKVADIYKIYSKVVVNAKLLFLQFCFDLHIWHWILMLMWGKNHCPEYMYIFLSIGLIWLCFFYRVSVVREYAVTLNGVWWSRSYRIIQKSLKAYTCLLYF